MPTSRATAARASSSFALALLLLSACASIDTGSVARRTAAELLACEVESTELVTVGAYRYQGRGCGGRVDVVCTASALEPRCYDERELVAAAGQNRAEPEASESVEANIRAGLDGRREDILACTGSERAAVRVAYAEDGSVEVSLQGALQSTPEERCVQNALRGVRVSTGAAGTVVHLVQ